MSDWDNRAYIGVAVAMGLLLVAGVLSAMEIVGFDPKKHARFSSGYPVRPVPNESPEFVGKGFDWSGVGWEATAEGRESLTSRALTMVSPQHFVYSGHFKYEEGRYGIGKIKFFSPTLKTTVLYTVDESVKPIQVRHPRNVESGAVSDIWVGTLTEKLDPAHGIKHYPVLVFPSVNHYRGQKLFTYAGRGAKIGVNSIDGVSEINGTVIMGFRMNSNQIGESFMTSGDSGSPSFVPVDGKLTLVGLHYLSVNQENEMMSLDSFMPAYIEQMRAAGVPVEVLKPDY
ncbi:MAG: hypothetical protein AAF591_12355 [Verrucomicrobiota bacterium]